MTSSKRIPDLVIRINKRNRKYSLQYEMFALFLNTIMLIDLLRLLMSASGVISVVRDGLYVFEFLYMIYHAISIRKVYFPMAFIVTYAVLSAMSILFYDGIDGVVISGSLIFITRCITGLYYARYLTDYNTLWGILRKYYIMQLAYCLLYMSTHLDFVTDGSYMTFSYNILFLTILLLISAFEKPDFVKIAGAAFFIAIIFAYGARGPVVCILISVFLYILYANRKATLVRRIGLTFAVLIICAILYFGFGRIIDLIKAIYPSSRTIYMLEKVRLFNSSGRDSLFGVILSEFQKNILVPHGLYSDRVLLAQKFGGVFSNYYSHNIGIELLYQFGGLFGGALIVYLLFSYIRSFRFLSYIEDDYTPRFWIAMFSGMSTLLFSSSYLVNERGWVSLGIALSVIHLWKHQHKTGDITAN